LIDVLSFLLHICMHTIFYLDDAHLHIYMSVLSKSKLPMPCWTVYEMERWLMAQLGNLNLVRKKYTRGIRGCTLKEYAGA